VPLEDLDSPRFGRHRRSARTRLPSHRMGSASTLAVRRSDLDLKV
jgi:hypothetical protein